MDFRSGRPRVERRVRDRRQTERGGPDRRESRLAVIRWTNPDGTESVGHPLPRAHAEALLLAYQRQFPLPTFWLEIPPPLA